MILRCVFLNCCNLFQAGAAPSRFGGDQAELDRKLDALAATLAGFFPGGQPDLIGLCEVGDETLAREIAQRLAANRYLCLWSGVPATPWQRMETGLATLYDPGKLSPVEPAPRIILTPSGRRACQMASLFQLRGGTRGAFWWIVNHWKSRMGGVEKTEPDRMESAAELGNFFLETAREETEAMIAIGDFNCEPGEQPFHRQRGVNVPANALRSVRERALVSREGNRLAYFYCPMWRAMAETDPVEGPAAPRPWPSERLGTFAASGAGTLDWAMFDQLLVTRPLLSRAPVFPLGLLEATLSIQDAHGGCSDHRAVGARFEY
jgi:hypothetical protein